MRDELTVLPRPAREPSPTTRDLLAVFFRHRKLVLVSFLIAALAGILYGTLLPSYQSHMKFLVRRGRIDPSVAPMVLQAAPFNRTEVTEEDLNSEAELLRDQEILRTVIDDSGLVLRNSWRNWLGRDSQAERQELAIRTLALALDVKPLRKTALVEVSYSSADPAESVRVLRNLAHAYLQRHVRVQQPSGQFDFFEQQASRAQQGLEQAQVELVNFTREEGIVSAALERDNALQRLNEAEAGYRQVEVQIAETTQRYHSLLAQQISLPTRTIRQERSTDNGDLLAKLKTRLLELQLKRTELLTKFSPTYRLVREADAQLADTRASIAEEQARPLRDQTTDANPDYEWDQAELLKARVELSSLHSRAEAAGRVVSDYRRNAAELGNRALQQDSLLRGLKMAEANYLLYMGKREEARIGDALDQNGILNVSIAEQPSVPALPSRSAMSFGAMGIFVGGMFGTAAAFIADRLDPSFRTPDEVALYLATPVLASLPQKDR